MQRRRNISQSNLKLGNWSQIDLSQSSKKLETSITSKSAVSRYSMFKDVHNQKWLNEELINHGQSIIYNFGYNSIMTTPHKAQLNNNTSHLPELFSPATSQLKRQRIKMVTSNIIKPQSLETTTEGSTNRLKEKIKGFLRPADPMETQQAIDAIQKEVKQFKEKNTQQWENIRRVLKTTELQDIDENMAYLQKKSIYDSLARMDADMVDPTAMLKKAGIHFRHDGKRPPVRMSVARRIKKYTAEDADGQVNTVFYTPKLVGKLLGPNSNTRLNKSASRGDIQAQDLSPLRNSKLNNVLEDTKGSLETRLSPYRLSPVKDEGMSRLMSIQGDLNGDKIEDTLSKYKIHNRDTVRLRLIKIIKSLRRKLERMNLTVYEIMKNRVFPNQPYEREDSKAFIKYAKLGEYDKVRQLLKGNRYLVYEYDTTRQTALHWTIKRGFGKLSKLILEHGADPDARDMNGRTPLFLAAKEGNHITLKLLLWYGADPWIKSTSGKQAMYYASNDMVKLYLRRSYKFRFLLDFHVGRTYGQIWDGPDRREFEVKDDELGGLFD